MSELINSKSQNIRWHLLVSASAAALLAATYAAGTAEAADTDTDRPTVWIELGGQLQELAGSPEILSPPFFALASDANRSIMTAAQHAPRFGLSEEGKITFQPKHSDLQFSVSVTYGRSSSGKHFHNQTQLPSIHGSVFGKYQTWKSTGLPAIFADGQTSSSEKHVVLDFKAGKDVGLGLFGEHGNSKLSAGVRFAQFTSSSQTTIRAQPFASYYFHSNPGLYKIPIVQFGVYTAFLKAKRDTHAVGPSISWDASMPFVGGNSSAVLSLDWGIDAALLFGRQRARVHHQTAGYYLKAVGGAYVSGAAIKYSHRYDNTPPDQDRSRSVTIPNIGGFAGLSFRYAEAKLSAGYRADFFFNAMDSGIDQRKSSTLGFYGPFATVSIGLGG